jgi:hypothetical protein
MRLSLLVRTSSPTRLDKLVRDFFRRCSSNCTVPITPPANVENRAQFVPNWNSMGMPVTTPMAKLTAKIFAQNFALRLKNQF